MGKGSRREKQGKAARGEASALPPTQTQLPATEVQEEEPGLQPGPQPGPLHMGEHAADAQQQHRDEEVSGWSGWRRDLTPCMIVGCLN
jgi:hypothetical protein